MTSSESEEQPPSRKRPRTSTDTHLRDSRNKKARGRPRVDTEDATAADRRRTQIRLAQRAYRQRKETTIAELKERNSQLMSVIEKMNLTFTHFKDSALESGLRQWNPVLGQELDHLTDTFVTLVKSAATEGSQDENSDTAFDPATELHNAASTARQTTRSPATSNHFADSNAKMPWFFPATTSEQNTATILGTTPLNNDGTALASLPPYGTADQSLIRRVPALATEQMLNQPVSSMNGLTDWPELPFGLIDMRSDQIAHQGNSRVYTPSNLTPQTTPPITRLKTPPLTSNCSTSSAVPRWTYSHDETTFARRLTRAAFEAAFHLLSNKNAPPALVKSVFKVSLAYMSIDQLRDRFRTLLSHGIDENLDCGGTPFHNLGGAGTHYSRRNANSPTPSSWYIRSVGPPYRKRIRAEHSTDPSMSHDLEIDLTGFEGEWLDPEDVEGYLEQEKGCHIDPKDSFAEVLVDEDGETNVTEAGSVSFSRIVDMDLSSLNIPHVSQAPSDPSLSNGSWSGESSSNSSTPSRNTDSAFGASETFGLDMGMSDMKYMGRFSGIDVSTIMDQPLGLDLASGYGTNPSNAIGALNAASFGGMANAGSNMADEAYLPVVKQTRKKTAWVDISRLVEELIKRSVCLGRAPGFRRRDVDVAFQKSLITAF